MVEVVLRIDGKYAFDYESTSAPQVGEYLKVRHKYANGSFKVTKVTHTITHLPKERRILHYLEVEAETVNLMDFDKKQSQENNRNMPDKSKRPNGLITKG